MSKVVFGCTALMGVNKGGTLKPDSDGYYTIILGALDFTNSYGAIYPFESAKHLFEKASTFQRRVKNGFCRGEYGHPKRQPGQSFEDFLIRIMTIEETRTCMTIEEVWLDSESVVHDGKKVIAIMGKIKPSGPYGTVLKEQLDNPRENVAFSLRSITDDEYVHGRLLKHIVDIAGWDYVTEPGLAVANKYKCPSLESFMEDAPVSVETLRRMVKDESRLGMESTSMLNNVIHATDRRVSKRFNNRGPGSSRW